MAVSIIVAAVSFAYSYMQGKKQKERMRKMQEEADRRADAAKGFQIATDGESKSLSIVYGRAKIAGSRVYHNTFNSVSYTAPTSDFNQFGSTAMSGEKHEMLVIQQALCFGGINRAVWADVNDVDYSERTINGTALLRVCPSGGIVDPVMSNTDPARANAFFTNTAYATCVFRLNRDEPQYNGVPNVAFYVEGLKVRDILLSAGVYSLSSTYSYTNNPALCILDYLLNPVYGRGLSVSDIDLPSFYKAARISEEVVRTDATRGGKYWTHSSESQHIKRFECNIVLDSSASIRDNIEKMLEAMDMAELIWTEGTYKLLLNYPTKYTTGTYAMDDVVQYSTGNVSQLYRSKVNGNTALPTDTNYWATDVAIPITDDDIMLGEEFSATWPNAQSRYNKVKCRYLNEANDFKEDTAFWPPLSSPLRAAMLSEDNGVALETELFEDAVTDYYHATAKAENRCRDSRFSVLYKMVLSPRLIDIEPNAILQITSTVFNVPGELVRVTSVAIKQNGTVAIEGERFSAEVLAWNMTDTEVIPAKNITNFAVEQATNLVFSADNRLMSNSPGILSWTHANDVRVNNYKIYFTTAIADFINANTSWEFLGESKVNSFSLPQIPAGVYVLAVVAQTNGGILADQFNTITGSKWPVVSVGVSTNGLGGVITFRATIYQRAASVPATPVGGSLDFTSLILTPPSGWYVVPPIGVAQLYQVDAVIRETDTSIAWDAPLAIASSTTYTYLSKPIISIVQDAAGNNVGYGDASGTFNAILNGINVNEDVGTTFSIVANSQDNCVATISNTIGTKGQFLITTLYGDVGSVTFRVSYNGGTFDKTVSIYALKTGYQVDTSLPPTPSDITVTMGMDIAFIDLASLPNYTQGHGHSRTEVYGAATDDPANATLIDYFDGTSYVLSVGLNKTYYIWFKNRTKDGYLSAAYTSSYNVSTTLINAETYIEDASISFAKIQDAAITTAKIKDGQVTNAKIGDIIQSTTYNLGYSGWSIDKSGSAVFNNLTIYDGAGNIVMASGSGVSWSSISGANKPANNATRNIYKGPWAPANSYVIGDSVLNQNSTWVALADHISSGLNAPPSLPTASNSYWGLYASVGSSGADASIFYIKSSASAIAKNKSGVFSPTNLQISLYTKTGLSLEAPYLGRIKIYEDGNASASYSSAVNESSYTYTPPTTLSSVKIEFYAANGFTVLLDSTIIPVVREGTDALVASLSNPVVTMPSANDGTVSSYSNSGTNIEVWEGTSKLTYSVAPAPGQFYISSTSQSPSSTITIGAISSGADKAIVADHSAMLLANDSVNISYNILAKRLDGTTSNIVATQRITKAKAGVTGVNGARTAVLTMYQWATSAPTTFPSGTSTYTWSTGLFTAPATVNGWSINPPAAVAGQTLWSCKTLFSDSLVTATSSVTWSSSAAYAAGGSGSAGIAGVNGTRTAIVDFFKWSASVPTTFPSGTSTYTWSNATYTLPATSNGWSLLPPAAIAGHTLYCCSQSYSDTNTTSTSAITVNTTSPYAIGAAGANGVSGVVGVLSNESHILVANAAGVVSSFAGCSSSLSIYEGATDVTGLYSISVTPTAGVTGSLSSQTYTVSALSTDAGTVTFNATRASYPSISKVFSIAKSKAGADGSAVAPFISLTADSQSFYFSSNVASPSAQTITLTCNRTNLPSAAVWTVSPSVTLTGTGDTRTLSVGDFGNNRQVMVTVTADGISDSVSIVRLDQENSVRGKNLVRSFVAWSVGAGCSVTGSAYALDGIALLIPSGINAVPSTTPLALAANVYFTLSFQAWTSGANRTLTADLYPDTLPETSFLLTSTPKTYYTTWSSADTNMAACTLRLFGSADGASSIYITNLKFEVGDLPSSWAGNLADTISITNPLLASNSGNFIGNAAITNAMITNQIYSSNFVPGTTGWIIDKTGNAEFNTATFRGTLAVKSAASGQRTEIRSNAILVYDAAGTCRVKIGDMTAT